MMSTAEVVAGLRESISEMTKQGPEVRETLLHIADLLGKVTEPATAAHVVTKERTGGGRDEPPHFYLVGPRRETQEEALSDLKRWEEGQQEGEPVAAAAWAYEQGIGLAFYDADEEHLARHEAGGHEVFALYRGAPPPAAPSDESELRKVARPFAEEIARFDGRGCFADEHGPPGSLVRCANSTLGWELTFGDWRRLRAALDAAPPVGDEAGQPSEGAHHG